MRKLKEGFQSQRGCREHVNNKHSWFFYFGEKPVHFQLLSSSSDESNDISLTTSEDNAPRATSKPGARSVPPFSVCSQIGDACIKWLTGSGGGYNIYRPAQQIVSRCFKFLKFCYEEEEELNFEVLDFSLCYPSLLFNPKKWKSGVPMMLCGRTKDTASYGLYWLFRQLSWECYLLSQSWPAKQ